jgi:hypothetical protein
VWWHNTASLARAIVRHSAGHAYEGDTVVGPPRVRKRNRGVRAHGPVARVGVTALRPSFSEGLVTRPWVSRSVARMQDDGIFLRTMRDCGLILAHVWTPLNPTGSLVLQYSAACSQAYRNTARPMFSLATGSPRNESSGSAGDGREK